jgi:hypothetical protein
MKSLFLILLLLYGCTSCFAQDSIAPEVKNLALVAGHYKSVSSLQMELSYKVYADTLEKKLLDSASSKFISYNGKTYTSQLNTVSIVGDTFVFFIDHEQKLAYLEKKPEVQDKDIIKSLQSLVSQNTGIKDFGTGKGKHRYRVLANGMVYQWIDLYADLESKTISKIVYRFSDYNQTMKGAKLMVIEFYNQKMGEPVKSSLFSTQTYITFSGNKQGALLPAFKDYKFYNYLY